MSELEKLRGERHNLRSGLLTLGIVTTPYEDPGAAALRAIEGWRRNAIELYRVAYPAECEATP